MIISDNEDALPLTPEQIGLKIAELQAEKSAADLARSKEETNRLQAQQALQETNAEETLRIGVGATGIKFYAEPDELKTVLKAMGYLFTASTRGDSIRVITPEGKQGSLESALESLAVKKPYLADSDTTRHLRPRDEKTGEFAELSRDDFQTIAAKSHFIRENPGVWETLPQRRLPKTPVNQLTARQYSALPLNAKSKLVSELGPGAVEEIMRRR